MGEGRGGRDRGDDDRHRRRDDPYDREHRHHDYDDRQAEKQHSRKHGRAGSASEEEEEQRWKQPRKTRQVICLRSCQRVYLRLENRIATSDRFQFPCGCLKG